MTNAIFVFDEVHNLPSLLRDVESEQLTVNGLDRALAESEGKPMLQEFVEGLIAFIEGYGDEEQTLSVKEFLERLNRISGTPLSVLAEIAEFEGSLIRKALLLQGKRPRSSLNHLANFLRLVNYGLSGYG